LSYGHFNKSEFSRPRAKPAIRLSRKSWLFCAIGAVLEFIPRRRARFGILPRRLYCRGGGFGGGGDGRRSIEQEIPMPTPKSNRQTRSRPNSSKAGRNRAAQITGRKSTKLKAVEQQNRPPTPQKARAGTKQVRIIAMLRTPSGATIDAMAQATGWQPHSVRGFLAGVIRKKLGLHLGSEPAENGRIYRITTASSTLSAATTDRAR